MHVHAFPKLPKFLKRNSTHSMELFTSDKNIVESLTGNWSSLTFLHACMHAPPVTQELLMLKTNLLQMVHHVEDSALGHF